jgi:hypothetical protein
MKIPVHNPSAMPIYVHAAMILPGETRHFDEQDVPSHMRPKTEDAAAAVIEPPPDLIAQLIKLSIKDITEAFDVLSEEDLARLDELENADTPRKGLVAAIAEEKLRRAAEKNADPDAGGNGKNNEGDKGNEES